MGKRDIRPDFLSFPYLSAVNGRQQVWTQIWNLSLESLKLDSRVRATNEEKHALMRTESNWLEFSNKQKMQIKSPSLNTF